jgi:PTS system N-acetylglucosamine-specific IIC component
MKSLLARLQPIGRALMLPIAVLPIAALLLRLGQPDLLATPAIAAAGDAIFSNLGLLFAIGIAIGLARENHGAAGLAAVVGFLVATKGAEALLAVPASVTENLAGQAQDLAIAAYRAKELAKLSVPAGLLSGIVAGALYNAYSEMRLPSYLAFFGGRRFVPIASGCAGIVFALCFGYGWPVLERGMDVVSQAVLGSESLGLFAYGVLNRVLIVTGLHHIINNIAWFLLGDFNGVTGDLKRFFAGDPQGGAFMSGFFPVMMFGLPAACLAMYRAARPERRKAVGGLLVSMALTSFLTGVTEPIEFTFMFIAPALYALHAVLTGVAMALTHYLGMRLGFGFSAGLFDYVLNYSLATRPLLLLPFGGAYFALYYVVFRYYIVRFNVATPGREPDSTTVQEIVATEGAPANSWVNALGGARNLVTVDACTTRLRLVIANQDTVNTDELKRLGARGFIRPSHDTLQVVVGPIADQLAVDIRHALKRDASAAGHGANASERLLAAIGGRENVRTLELATSRLCFTVADPQRVDIAALRALAPRGIAQPHANSLHVLVGANAAAVFASLQA